MNTIKIAPNLLFEYQCTSGKFIRLPNRIEKIDSIARIESNRIETFLSELECSNKHSMREKIKNKKRNKNTIATRHGAGARRAYIPKSLYSNECNK